MKTIYGKSGLRGLRRQQMEAAGKLFTLCASTVLDPLKRLGSVVISGAFYSPTDQEQTSER